MPLSISLYVFLLCFIFTHFKLLSKTPKAKTSKKVIYLVTGNSLKLFYDLRSLLKTLRLTIGSNGRPVTNYPPPLWIHSISSTPITSIKASLLASVNSIFRLIVNPETQLSTRWPDKFLSLDCRSISIKVERRKHLSSPGNIGKKISQGGARWRTCSSPWLSWTPKLDRTS